MSNISNKYNRLGINDIIKEIQERSSDNKSKQITYLALEDAKACSDRGTPLQIEQPLVSGIIYYFCGKNAIVVPVHVLANVFFMINQANAYGVPFSTAIYQPKINTFILYWMSIGNPVVCICAPTDSPKIKYTKLNNDTPTYIPVFNDTINEVFDTVRHMINEPCLDL
jgi:hypothetical protein